MKRTILRLCAVLLCAVATAGAQALFEESFNYSEGALVNCGVNQPNSTSVYYPLAANNVSSGAWTNGSSSAFDDPLLVQSGALTYSGYSLSGIGKKLFCPNLTANSSNNRAYRDFTGQQTVYYTLLVNLREVTGLSAYPSAKGEYLTGLWATGNATNANFRGLLTFRAGTAAGTYQMGVLANQPGGTASWYDTDLSPLTTYLVVVKYERNNPTCKASLWINPSLGGSEPSPNAVSDLGTTETVVGNTDVGRLGIYQRGGKPKVDLGGIKVATSWTYSPLPVELTSFTAAVNGNSIVLRWNTAGETNNNGFDIEKRMNDAWSRIGFVAGNGTSNAPHQYSFIDRAVTGRSAYRLKQIDRNGSCTYSATVETEGTTTSVFSLTQNYPNPFNPSTDIAYSLSTTGMVKITVSDILGREVAVLEEGIRSAGSHSVRFTAGQLNSGTYFYRLEAEGTVRVMKMMFIK